MSTKPAAEREALFLAKCLRDPVFYAENVMKTKLWSLSDTRHLCSRGCFRSHKTTMSEDGLSSLAGQDDVIRSAYYNSETAVKSCHGSGKTRVASILVPGWLTLHPPGSSLVITTSSSWGQVEGELWGDVHKMLPNSSFSYPQPNEFELKMPGGSRAFGMSTDKAVNFHGFHADHVLVIVDEVSGINADIMKGIRSIASAGNTHIVYLMNPVEASGPSVDLFDNPDVTKWTVDGLMTPNMRGYHIYEDPDRNQYDPDKAHNILYIPDEPPGECELDDEPLWYFLLRKRAIKRYYTAGIRLYGQLKPEDEWFPRVRGLFPREQMSQLIKREWVKSAVDRRVNEDLHEIFAGLDVAGPGKDETALCVRSGYQILKQQSWNTDDPIEEIIYALSDYERSRITIYVDAVAIGYGLCNELIHKGYRVVFCNASNRPMDTTRFYNAKAEWYWKMRELFQEGEIGGPIDELCQLQLLTLRWDRQNLKGLIRIEPKELAEKRGVTSPDRAEAMMLCFAATSQIIRTGQLLVTPDEIVHGNAATALKGPGWESQLEAGAGELPRAAESWMVAIAEQKASKKQVARKNVEALMQPHRTALYDSTGNLIGHRETPIERMELERLLSLLEPAD